MKWLVVLLLSPLTLIADVVIAIVFVPAVLMYCIEAPWPFTPELWKRLIG